MLRKLYTLFSLIIIIQLLLGSIVSAQFLIASAVSPNGVLPTPDAFDSYPTSKFITRVNEGVKLVSNHLESSSELAWAVFSDREDNETYHDAFNKRDVKNELKFRQRCFVIEVDGNWLHLVTVKHTGFGHKVDLDLGWIEANKLMLSKYPVLSNNGAPKKKMILMSASDFDPDGVNQDIFNDMNYFSNPELINKYETQRKADKFQILFVVKETEESVLLSSTDKISNVLDVYGWIHKVRTTDWDTRVCLEPISGKPAEQLQNSDVSSKSAFVFLNTYDLNSFSAAGQITPKVTYLKELPIRKKRMLGTQMRYPVMPWDDNSSVKRKIAVIAQLGDLEDENGEVCDKECQRAKLKYEVDSINKLANTVNALIIIDGTSSMRKYGPEVAESIEKIINERQIDGQQNMRWGLAIYRDYVDKDRKFEIIPLNDDPKGVVNKLRQIDYNSVDSPHSEAHYYGMTQAIKRAGFQKGESNLIVLVGDAGNHREDINNLTKQSVINLLAEKRINIISFQVNFLTGQPASSYSKFSADSKNYILESAKKFIDKLDNSDGLDVKLVGGESPGSYSLGFTGFENEGTKPMFGTFNHAIPGKAMSIRDFRNNLVNSLSGYLKGLDKQKERLDCLITGNCELSSPGSEKDKGPIFDGKTNDICRLLNFSDEQCQLFVDQGQISISGYTHMKLGNNFVYTPVAYISKTYKATLDERLGDLAYISGSGYLVRDQFYNTLVSLIQGLVGEQTSEEVIKQWTFGETWDIILNIPFSDRSPLNNKQIKDLLTDNISQDDFEMFLGTFKSQTQAFIDFPRDRDLKHSEYKSGSQTFYWIPFSKIPRGEE